MEEIYTLPDATHTIFVTYDFASRPTVYEGNNVLWLYEGEEFMENTYVKLSWKGEDTLYLTFDGEEIVLNLNKDEK